MGWKDLTEDLDSINNKRSNKNFVIWSGSLNRRKTKGEKIKDITKKKDEFRRIVTDNFNDMVNIKGNKIKIIFGTTAIMEGIDFKHVKYVHILNLGGTIQTMKIIGVKTSQKKKLTMNKKT